MSNERTQATQPSQTGASSSHKAPKTVKEFASPVAEHDSESGEFAGSPLQRALYGNPGNFTPPAGAGRDLPLRAQAEHTGLPPVNPHGPISPLPLDRKAYIDHLQRTVGNAEVGRLWRSGELQRRLGMPVQRAPEKNMAQRASDDTREDDSVDARHALHHDIVQRAPGDDEEMHRKPGAAGVFLKFLANIG